MIVFFFKQKTADELRISDWSSDVCSSDLHQVRREDREICILTGRQRALDVPLAGKPRGPLRPEPERGLPVEHVLLAVERHAAERLAGRQPVEADPGIVGGDTRRVGPGTDRKRTRLNSSHYCASRMPSSA